jgi:hypothetical protein
MASRSRECRCTCDGFAMVLRVASFLAHAATGAAAGWGFLIANERFKDEKAAEALTGNVADSLKALNASYAFFQGIMAAYYWCVRRVRQCGLRARVRTGQARYYGWTDT